MWLMLPAGLAHAQTPATACPAVDPQALVLPAVLVRAQCLEPGLARLRAAAVQAGAVRDERDAAFKPSLSAQVTPSASTQRGDGTNTHAASAQASLVLSQTLLDGGARNARSGQAREQLAASQSDLTAQTLASQREMVGVWAAWRDALDAVDAADVSVASAQAAFASAEARFRAGSAARTDVLSARAALASAQRSRIDAQATRAQTQVRLAQRLALSTELRPVGQDAPLLPAGFTTAIDAVATHPQAAAQRSRVAAAQAQVDAARSEDRATLSASASLGPQWSRGNALTGRDDHRTQLGGEVGLVWSMPLSDGGARQSRIAQALAQADAERARLAEVERGLAETLTQAQAAAMSAQAQLAAAQVAFEAAAESEAAQRARYQAGAGTLADWLSAQSELASSRRQAQQARQQVLRADIQLLTANGQAL